jgi:hypothetical protein
MSEVRRNLDQRIMEDKKLSTQREITYQAKAEAFEIPEVNDERNKDIKSKIRQAHNVTEVTALTAIAIMRLLESDR